MKSIMKMTALLILSTLLLSQQGIAKSVCYGTSAKGRIENAEALPTSGDNYESYSIIGVALQRNYVHEFVRNSVLQAYEILAFQGNKQKFVYGETGWPEGGRFKPHKSHQAGLSVDFMVPLLDKNGRPTPFPHNVLNKWGYDLEFDREGRMGDLQIDFESISQHLLALKKATKMNSIDIRYVIFEPKYHKFLESAPSGKQLKGVIKLYEKPVWIRHDEHYHIEFQVPCRP